MAAAPKWEKLAATVLRKADGELDAKLLRKRCVKRAAKKQAAADLSALKAAFDAALPTLGGVSVRDGVARVAESAARLRSAAGAAPDDGAAARPRAKASRTAAAASAPAAERWADATDGHAGGNDADGDDADGDDADGNDADAAAAPPPARRAAARDWRRDNPAGTTRLFVGNLAWKIDEAKLRAVLAPSEVTHIKWMHDRTTKLFYGTAFIEVADAAQAAACVARAGADVLGRPIKLNYAPPHDGIVWPPPQAVVGLVSRAGAGADGGGWGGAGGGGYGGGASAMSEKPDFCRKLFAGNLPYDVTDDDLWDFFGRAGEGDGETQPGDEIRAIRYLTHRETDEFKGCAYVEFNSTRDADAAARRNGELLKGRPIRLDWGG